MNKLSIQYDRKRFTEAENELIGRALEFALTVHADQKRASGDPYVIHPIAVAEIVAEWGLGSDVVAAALLHDVIEDTPTTSKQLEHEFGPKITELVKGLTKLELATPARPDPDSARLE